MRILIESYYLKDGSEVTKRKGEKVYKIRRKLKIFGGPEKSQEIKLPKGFLFLVDESGFINLIEEDTEVLLIVDEEDTHDLLVELGIIGGMIRFRK